MVQALINHYCNGNKAQFASILGIKPQTINSWIARNSFDAELIYAKCVNVSADWLMTGRGEMLIYPLNDRLSYITSLIGTEEASRCLNVSLGELLDFNNGGNTPEHFFDLHKLLREHPEIQSSWLLKGIGEPLKGNSSKEEKAALLKNKVFNKELECRNKDIEEKLSVGIPTNNSKEGIPLIPIEAMAGALTSEMTVLEYECERYVVPVFKGADFLIPVKGSSMYPKYSSGDIVACQRVSMSELFFQWNKVYVIDTNQGALIKRIKPGSDKDHVLLVSDNEKYDPFELPFSAIHAVALVLGVIRLE